MLNSLEMGVGVGGANRPGLEEKRELHRGGWAALGRLGKF